MSNDQNSPWSVNVVSYIDFQIWLTEHSWDKPNLVMMDYLYIYIYI